MPIMHPHRRTQMCRASTNQEEKCSAPSLLRWVPRKSQGVDDLIERKAPKLFDPFNKPKYDELDELPMTKILTDLFRHQLQRQADAKSPASGFKGLLEEVEKMNVKANGSAITAQELTLNVFKGTMPSTIPYFYKHVMHKIFPTPVENALFAHVTATFFGWLVGDLRVLTKEDVAMLDPELTGAKVGQGVRIERCRFLEEAGPCAGTCMNNCKIPTQRWMMEDFGVPVRLTPNYEDYSCVFAYGVQPIAAEDDPGYNVPCFSQCTKRKRSSQAQISGELEADQIQCGDVTKRTPRL
eukprot:CAMPEP_0198205394 /NCGR_PEP_ID=MMETSP1445-20131203/8931_1 /TAXON_ID=36898 /ORGANISM="Pyramimonas sp., Strain CCMP2087" /LENGTH=295 /DNA_ID=CAMNT_0043877687 /DNA_START=399 /DNA_END=1286 /DNA_ORIENTATION=+